MSCQDSGVKVTPRLSIQCRCSHCISSAHRAEDGKGFKKQQSKKYLGLRYRFLNEQLLVVTTATSTVMQLPCCFRNGEQQDTM